MDNAPFHPSFPRSSRFHGQGAGIQPTRNQAVKISLVGLGATALFQLVIVLISGSVALLADTVHNFSDALTAVPLWIAFLLGRRAATKTYTYGYGKAEDLAGLFIVAMIALSAIVAAVESIRRFVEPPQPVQNLGWVLAAGVVGFLGNEIVAIYRIRVGRAIGSAAWSQTASTPAQTDSLPSLSSQESLAYGSDSPWRTPSSGYSYQRPSPSFSGGGPPATSAAGSWTASIRP